jgi:hypothetical protein
LGQYLLKNQADESTVHRVGPKLYTEFDLNPDSELASEVTEMLKDAGLDAAMDPKFEQIHDTL